MPLPDNVAALARAIAERHQVDWASAQASSDPEWRDAIRELEVIAEIAAFHGKTENGAPQAWGAFRILELAGHGTYGHVYRAIDPRLDREVALKLMPAGDEATEGGHTAAIEEARLLARVRHPNVVTIYGADWIDGRVGLWMEFVQGRTLEQVLQQDGPLAPRDLTIVCRDVCGALDAVHEAGLLHRDIKAQNVMRDATGRHVLMDFGAGRRAGRFGSADLAGTPLYLAPELLNGEPASRQSDIYSVGVLLFHLATGRYPVDGSTLEELRARHAAGDLSNLPSLRPDYPEALVKVIERALGERASDRFDTARAMAEAASRIVDGDPLQMKRRPLVWAAASVVVLLATAIATVPRLLDQRGPTASSEVRARLLWDDATDLGGTTSADGRLLSFTDWSTASLAVRKTAYEISRSDWSSDVCSSDLCWPTRAPARRWKGPPCRLRAGRWRTRGLTCRRLEMTATAPTSCASSASTATMRVLFRSGRASAISNLTRGRRTASGLPSPSEDRAAGPSSSCHQPARPRASSRRSPTGQARSVSRPTVDGWPFTPPKPCSSCAPTDARNIRRRSLPPRRSWRGLVMTDCCSRASAKEQPKCMRSRWSTVAR